MATTQATRRRPAQASIRNSTTSSYRRKPPRHRGRFRFDEANGKTVEFVEFYTDDGFHCVEIGFDDKTAIDFTIEPTFYVEPEYSNWKTGNQRILRRWETIHSS